MSLFSIDGSEDQWLLLQRVSRDDRPLVVRTRAGNSVLRDHAERNGIAIVRGVIEAAGLAQNLMPASAISEDLYTWEDQILETLSSRGVEAFALAVVSGDGRRDLFFATSDPAGLAGCVEAVVVPDMVTAAVEPYVDAALWWPLLVPTDLEAQLNGDRAVLQSLEEQGDDGLQSRKVDFWFYGNRPNLEALVAELEAEGFVLESWLDEPVGMVVSLHSPATGEVFDILTPRLLTLASAHHVEYDGWESIVLSAPAAAEARHPSILTKIFRSKNN